MKVVYRHRNGKLYRMSCCAENPNTGEFVVVYYGVDGSGPWFRPSQEFHEKFDAEPDPAE